MQYKIKNSQGGFLKTIFLLVILFFIISYYHISVSDVIHWLENFIRTIFAKLNLN